MNLREVLIKLSDNNRNFGVFHSEADFQFQLGLHLKEFYPEHDIIFEYLCNNGERIDIVVISPDGEKTPIELKYFTKATIELPFINIQNDTWRCYDVIKDIKRVEGFLNNQNSKKGFVILLSNHPIYWNGPKGEPNYYNFRLNQGRVIKPGNFAWLDPSGKAISKGRKIELSIINEYTLNWQDYKTVGKSKFKFLVIESNR
jgi:hypothetical protein